MTVEKLQEIVEKSLVNAFANKYTDRDKISVYPNSGDIFMEEDGIAVYCDVNLKPFSWFDGSISFIVASDTDVMVNLFIGDNCIDPERIEDLDLDDIAWSVETVDDFLMLETFFELGDDEQIESKLTERLVHLKSEGFSKAIKPLADCFR